MRIALIVAVQKARYSKNQLIEDKCVDQLVFNTMVYP